MNEAQIVLLVVYLFPAIVAALRRHMNESAICVLTILLGWTVIGWIIALVWACTANTKANRQAIVIPIEGRVREISQAEQVRSNVAARYGDPSMAGVLSLILAIFVGAVLGFAILARY